MRFRRQKRLTGSRFLPLADIFIAAIACLLILIIVSRQSRTEVNNMPQADFVLLCQVDNDRADLLDDEFKKQYGAPYEIVAKPTKNSQEFTRICDNNSLAQCKQHFRSMTVEGRLSVRVLLKVSNSVRNCGQDLKDEVVVPLNQTFDNPETEDTTDSFILIDTVFMRSANSNEG